MFKILSIFLTGVLPLAKLIAGPVSIHVENRRDYEILDQFFRMGIFEEEYGYVLMGLKPISVRNFYSLDSFPIAKDLQHTEKEFTNVLLVRESIPVWDRLCSQQNNFVLKVVPLEDSESVVPGWEVQFINLAQLREVIDTNIDLFRYILGPATKTDQLLKQIAYSGKQLNDILHDDLVLVGIVLGFGSHNSLGGGRTDTLFDRSLSRDCAPFASKGRLLQNTERHRHFGSYYLDYAGGGEDTLFRRPFSPLEPSQGFVQVEDELLALKAMDDPLPGSLQQEPAFVFGAYKEGSSNQPFFVQLQKVQRQIQELLHKSNFLECVLEKIGGKRPRITCKPSHETLAQYSIPSKEWSRMVQRVADHCEDQQGKRAFIEAFHQPSASSRVPPRMVGASRAILEGLKRSLNNLTAANVHFEALSKDDSLQEIVPKQLYFKTTTRGSRKELKGADHIRVGYIIEDGEGNILFANHDAWLHLSQTIPGFAHGIQRMCVGEKRMLFVHPALAYGVLTTLPPCSELRITVQLLDIEDKVSNILPSLTPLDLEWIQDPAFYRVIEESIEQKPRFIGSFYRDLLDKVQGVDTPTIIAALDKELKSF
jgi:FKBP-type peptidyl-prolyl cis-trans isomerase